jgi:hypothetical protein
MLKFNALSLSQKRFVVSVLESNPQYRKDPKITLKECAAIYYTMRDQRTGQKGEKIGYPNWLFNKNKVDRGVYQLPVPTDAELSAYAKEIELKVSPVKVAKAKVAKLAKAKVIKASKVIDDVAAREEKVAIGRLQSIIDESVEFDDGDEDFDAILRENGIDVNAAY